MSVAFYDLTITQESNNYFGAVTNKFKNPQLEIIYYKAVNAAIKGDMNRANELLRQLAGEDERLYVVRMGKDVSNTDNKNKMKYGGRIHYEKIIRGRY